MVKLKNQFCTKIIVHGGTLLKSVSSIGFWEKLSFWDNVSFCLEMFCVTNFLLVLHISIVNAMIFIQKNIDKLVQDQFLQPVKVHPWDKFGHVDKIMPCFFFQKRLKNVKFKKIQELHAERDVFGFLITQFFFNHF